MMKKTFLWLFICGFFPFVSSAQVTDTLDTSKKNDEKKFSVHGYADTYYAYNFNNPENKNSFGTTGAGRAFYGKNNEFSIGIIQTKFEYQTKDTRVVADLIFGPAAPYMMYGNTGAATYVKQAYIERKFGKKWAVTVGEFGTHIGYEVFEAPKNFHYSLSTSFCNNPYYHTGIKANYQLTQKVGFMAGVVNGWDMITDNNNAKSIIAQTSFLVNDGFEIYLNWMGGNEETTPEKSRDINAFTQLFDLTSSYDVNDHLSLGLNASFGSRKVGQDSINGNWGGFVLYTSYELNDVLTLGLRGEVFDDTQKMRNINSYYQGLTFTSSISLPGGNVILKPEFRFDNSSKEIFYKGVNNDLTKSQSTISMSVIGKF